MDMAHLLALVRPGLAPIRYVLAVGAAEPVGPQGGGNLAESLRPLHNLLGRMLPPGPRPKAETTEELPRRLDLLSPADAVVAEATIDDRIAESDLDVGLKREQLVEARLRNERLALENTQLAQALDADQQRRMLIDRAIRRGQIDIADALRAFSPGDAQALGELGRRQLEVETRWEQDDEDE